MFKFNDPLYDLEELKYIYGALMVTSVQGEEVKVMASLQEKTLSHINRLSNLPPPSEPTTTHPGKKNIKT